MKRFRRYVVSVRNRYVLSFAITAALAAIPPACSSEVASGLGTSPSDPVTVPVY